VSAGEAVTPAGELAEAEVGSAVRDELLDHGVTPIPESRLHWAGMHHALVAQRDLDLDGPFDVGQFGQLLLVLAGEERLGGPHDQAVAGGHEPTAILIHAVEDGCLARGTAVRVVVPESRALPRPGGIGVDVEFLGGTDGGQEDPPV
jgi:hypothetical protein